MKKLLWFSPHNDPFEKFHSEMNDAVMAVNAKYRTHPIAMAERYYEIFDILPIGTTIHVMDADESPTKMFLLEVTRYVYDLKDERLNMIVEVSVMENMTPMEVTEYIRKKWHRLGDIIDCTTPE